MVSIAGEADRRQRKRRPAKSRIAVPDSGTSTVMPVSIVWKLEL
jgi:hypothetical protein